MRREAFLMILPICASIVIGAALLATFASVRDSATAVAARKAPQAQYQVRTGHALLGADESYIRKNPWFVKDTCAAIQNYYFRES